MCYWQHPRAYSPSKTLMTSLLPVERVGVGTVVIAVHFLFETRAETLRLINDPLLAFAVALLS